MGGMLNVSINYVPADGDIITFLGAESLSGIFSTVSALPEHLYLVYNYPGAGEISLRYSLTPLPVTLVSFTASIQGENNVLLQWQTTSELNNKGFEIEILRQGNTYQKIGFVQGNGTTNTDQRYQTVLFDLGNGVHYFRLKVIDMDGSFAYSRLRSVHVTNGLELTTNIYPNPVTGQYVYIELPKGATKKANVKIMNMLGRVISSVDYTKFTGPLKIEMPAATGAYLIEVTTEDILTVVKKVIRL